MKVCFISFEYPPEIIGGMGTYAQHIVEGLRKRGIDVSVITRGEETSHMNKIYKVVTSDRLYWRRFDFIKQAIRLFHSLNKICKFDLVHLNGVYPITRGFELPTVCTLHAPPNVKQMKMALRLRNFRSVEDITYLVLKTPVGSLCDVATMRMSDKIICPSTVLARDVISYRFADAQKIHVIPNGIDIERWDRIKCFDDSLLGKYGVQKQNFVLYMGRLSFLKGVEYLIEAFKKVQKIHPSLNLVIVGRGNFEQYLKKCANNMDGVLFLGHVNSMSVKKLLFEASLTVVLPSSAFEVSPMTILEAMACCKPVIGTNVGGVPSMIKHEKNGFLISPKDPDSLAECINILYENPDLSREMGMFSRKLVESKFALSKMVDRTLNVYKSLIRLEGN